MDSQSNVHGEYGRFEQIISQFLLKSLHIILDSRVPSIRPCSHRGEVRKSDKWFNLVLGDRPAALDNLNFWQRNLIEPMIIDIILVQESPNSNLGIGSRIETVIERWVVQYEYLRAMVPQVGDSSYKRTYKKSIVLLRTLYSTMRLLPAYKAFRKLSSSSQTCDFEINYKVSSFSAPFSRAEEELMKQYSFTPVEAKQGRLSISVTYLKNLSDFNLENYTSFPPEIIADYVGSPLTDPLRAFPSTTSGKSIPATSFPFGGVQSPSSLPLQRPHSWTSGIHRGLSSPQNQPFVGSPPLYQSPYELSSSPTEQYGQRFSSYRSPSYNKTSFDDYQLSPPFSPSPSPSPPTHLAGGSPLRRHLHSETAPVTIPYAMAGRSSKCLSPNLSDPNRHSLPPLSPKSSKLDSSSQESPSGVRLSRKPDLLRAGDVGFGISHPSQKVSRDPKDDSGRFSGLLSSSSSPRIGFSRSSSRLSFQDDLEEDFSGPFIVDDIDASDSPSSQNLGGRRGSESSSQANPTGRKSQDTAVAALVHMLRTAPPLRQDSSYYSPSSSKTQVVGEVGASSEFLTTRRTSDALEELKTYKDMKDLLLSKSASQVVSKEES